MMEATNQLNLSDISTEHGSLKQRCLIIGSEERLNIIISNKLHDKFHYNIVCKEDLDSGLDFLTSESTDLVIVDLDDISDEGALRLNKVLGHFQLPGLFISSDSTRLGDLRQNLDVDFISLLPKAILSNMFNDTLKILLKKTNPATKMSKRFMEVGTLEKPLSLYILAAGLFLEPLIKILYMKLQTGFDWEILMRTVFSIEGVINNIEFWALFPLAGYALVSIKSWSFFFFIGLQIYSVYNYITYEKFTWPYGTETPHISSGLLLFFNMALVLYFIVPANRRPYWNKTRRLWRNTSRYATSLQTKFKSNGKTICTTITNISETGAYFITTHRLPVGHKMELSLPIEGEEKKIEAIIRRIQETPNESYFGYGVEFSGITKKDKKLLKSFVKELCHRIQ